MKVSDAVNFFGSKTKVAAALNIYKSAVSQWEVNVPKLRAYEIQEIMSDPDHPKHPSNVNSM